MDTRYLQDFVDVCRAGSFAAAARARDVAPSTLSRSVASLEAELGVRLFQRTTRKLYLTEEGERFLGIAAETVARLDDAIAELAESGHCPSGRLRVSVSTSFGQEALVPILPDFLEDYPDITLDLQLTDARVDMLAEGVDVSIRHGRLADSAFVARKLLDVEYGLWASPDYLADQPPVSPEDLPSHALIGFTYPAFRDSWRLSRAGTVHDIAVSPRLRLTSAVAIRALAKAGQGIAILPDWCDTHGMIKVLPDYRVTGAEAEPAVWTLRPSRAHTPARVRAFLDYLQTSVA